MPYYEDDGLSLKRGDSGEPVEELQKDLSDVGYDIGGIDGVFGPRTEQAVRSFQETVLVDGMVDHRTASELHQRASGGAHTGELKDIPFIASPNFSSRKGIEVDMVVVHYTASASLETTVNWFENPVADASAHYVIDRDGKVVQMVKEEDKAWHAGRSEWEGQSDCNRFSIGIELVNWGELKMMGGKYYSWPGEYTNEYKGAKPIESEGGYWEPYMDRQYEVLTTLTTKIIRRYKVPLKRILGHCHVAPGRKVDPGPHFDWARFRRAITL